MINANVKVGDIVYFNSLVGGSWGKMIITDETWLYFALTQMTTIVLIINPSPLQILLMD